MRSVCDRLHPPGIYSGLVLQEWHKARTDWVTFREETAAPGAELVS